MKNENLLISLNLIEKNLNLTGLLEQVYLVIRKAIMTGEFEPGQWLRQRQLASELGVSQTTVRHALNQLAAESLIVIEPRRGFRTALPTPEYMRDLGDILIALEKIAIELALQTLTQKEIDRLKALIPDLLHKPDQRMAEIILADREFHMIIVTASNRPNLIRLFAQCYDKYHAFPFLNYSSEELALFSDNVHTHYNEIIKAVEAGDPLYCARACSACWEADMHLDRQVYNRFKTQNSNKRQFK